MEKYNPTKKRRVLLVFDYMIADMESNKILTPIVIKLIHYNVRRTYHKNE